MLDTPRIVKLDAQPAAIIRLTIPRAEIRNAMGPGMVELMAAVTAQGIAPAGPIFSHHLRSGSGTFDFELGVPVAKPLSAVGRVKMGELPAATVARTVYSGPFEALGSAWAEFDRWVTSEGHTPAADFWECYIAGPESSPDPAEWRTELDRPLIRQK